MYIYHKTIKNVILINLCSRYVVVEVYSIGLYKNKI